MFESIKNTFDKIVYDRLSSPLYGTLIISWLLWNWKIIYLTLFVSQEVVGNKIRFIEVHYSNPWILVAGPILSTFVILVLMPHLSNKAHELSLQFDKERIDKKNEIERSIMLTVEQGAQIVNTAEDQQKNLQGLLKKSEMDIQRLSGEVAVLTTEKDGWMANLNRLKVFMAMYGVDGKYMEDVTKQVQSKMQRNTLNIEVDRKALGFPDPVPGEHKKLIVYYEYKQNILRAHANDGGIITIGDPIN